MRLARAINWLWHQLFGSCAQWENPNVGTVHVHTRRKRLKECFLVLEQGTAAGSKYPINDRVTFNKIMAANDWIVAVAICRGTQ